MPKREKPPRGPQLDIAGSLGVAFVNTTAATPGNYQLGIETYADLLTWARQAGGVQGTEAEHLQHLAAEFPEEAQAVVTRALLLRSSLFRIFVAMAKQEQPALSDLGSVNNALAGALPAMRLVLGETGPTWGWGGDEDALDRVLWAPIRSAAEVLASHEGRPPLHQCSRKGCLLFFVDSDRRRIWCSEICRNRVKALKYYYRKVRSRRDRVMREGGYWRHKRPRERKH